MIADGDAEAFAALYERHHRGLLSFCRHTLGSREEAEDVVQHTFLAAYRQLGEQGRTLEAPRAWLYTVARNGCLTLLRTRRESGRESAEPATAGLADEVQRRADLRDLLSDVAELPEDQRSALILSELGDLSHDEIAEILGRPTAQIKALVFRARSALIEGRDARDTTCSDIREQLSTLTGGSLRRGSLRRHLRVCTGCSEFREQVRRQRTALGIVLPVVPTIGLGDTLAAASGAGSMGGAGLAGAGVGGAGAPTVGVVAGSSKVFAGLALKAGALKTVAVVATTGAVAAGGGVAVERSGGSDPRPPAESRVGAQRAAPADPSAGGAISGPAASPNEPGLSATGRERGSSPAQDRRDALKSERGKSNGLGGAKGRDRGASSRAPVAHGRERSGKAGGGAPPTKQPKQALPGQARPDGQATGGRPLSPGDASGKPQPGQRSESADESGVAVGRGRSGLQPSKRSKLARDSSF